MKSLDAGFGGEILQRHLRIVFFPKEEGGKPNALFLSLEIEGKP